jgi:alpha-mannosidase
VIGPDGAEFHRKSLAQEVRVFSDVRRCGYAVYDDSAGLLRVESTLKVTPTSLENHRYRITLNDDGDVASIFDKQLNRELLAAPIRLAIKNDTPAQWPRGTWIGPISRSSRVLMSVERRR